MIICPEINMPLWRTCWLIPDNIHTNATGNILEFWRRGSGGVVLDWNSEGDGEEVLDWNSEDTAWAVQVPVVEYGYFLESPIFNFHVFFSGKGSEAEEAIIRVAYQIVRDNFVFQNCGGLMHKYVYHTWSNSRALLKPIFSRVIHKSLGSPSASWASIKFRSRNPFRVISSSFVSKLSM